MRPTQFYFILFPLNEQRGGGGALPDFLFLFSFPCSLDHEWDWPQSTNLVVSPGWQPTRSM